MFGLNNYNYLEDLNLGLLKYMPHEKKILDLAAGFGTVATKYKEAKNIVVGIDNSPGIKGKYKKNFTRFYSEDITDTVTVKRLLGDERFDIILFADILEHLYDPVKVVKFYKDNFLAKKGLIYISVPNPVVWYTRIQILFGNYYYHETGTQDRTHIRFFTKNNIRKFAAMLNLRIKALDITPGIARYLVRFIRKKSKKKNSLLQSPMYRIYIKYVYPVEYLACLLLPGLFAYQYIVILENKDSL